MKRALLSTILGLAATVATYGQGTVQFNNYYSFGSVGAPIYLGEAMVDLLPIGASVSIYGAIGNTLTIGPATLLNTTTIGSGLTPEGYFDGGTAILPGYASGNATYALTASYGGFTGTSLSITIANTATGAGIPPVVDIPSFFVPVPEPSTFALLGLGAAAMMIFRRRQ